MPFVSDSFQNAAARLGLNQDNVASGATYAFSNLITRNPRLLEAMYRGSWLCGMAVDVPASDMVRAGVEFNAGIDPGEIDTLHGVLADTGVWNSVRETIQWSRLYGGAVAVVMIEGQDLSTEFRIDTVGEGSFQGLLVFDRWYANASAERVRTIGPDFGRPVSYDVLSDAYGGAVGKIHPSRCLVLDGVDLPHWQKVTEQGWGLSVLERVYDRLVAFDSTSVGAAQLVYKAHLRTLGIKGLRQIIGSGGPALEALVKQVDFIRKYQSAEGLTLLDAEDEFSTATYTFAGLDDVMLQFGQQLSGALQIPLVRLFGQSPAGMSATGESDLRTYYDGIAQEQEKRLRRPLNRLFDVLYRSLFGRPAPKGFGFRFTPLWQMSAVEKAGIAGQITAAVIGAEGAGIVGRATALKELRQASGVSGLWSNITDEDIVDAEQEGPPEPVETGEPDAGLSDVPADDPYAGSDGGGDEGR